MQKSNFDTTCILGYCNERIVNVTNLQFLPQAVFALDIFGIAVRATKYYV